MADATKWHGPYSLVFLQLLFTFMQLHDCSITRYCLSASVYDYNASNIDDTYGANGNICHAQKVNADLRTLPTLNDVFLIKTCHWYCWKYQCPWELSTLPSKHVQGWKCTNFCIFPCIIKIWRKSLALQQDWCVTLLRCRPHVYVEPRIGRTE